MLRSGSVEELKSIATAGRGFARTNLYYVYMPSLQLESSSYEHGVLCTSVTLPSRQLATVQRELGVAKQDIVYGFVNPNVNMTFRVLNDQKVREYFEYWQSIALQRYDDIEGRFNAAYPDTYCRKIEIYQLEKGVSYPVYNKDIDLGPINLSFDIDIGTRLEKNYKWTLDRAYPVSVTHETFSDASQNEISTITVEFSYQYWEGESLAPKNKLKNALSGVLGAVAANI